MRYSLHIEDTAEPFFSKSVELPSHTDSWIQTIVIHDDNTTTMVRYSIFIKPLFDWRRWNSITLKRRGKERCHVVNKRHGTRAIEGYLIPRYLRLYGAVRGWRWDRGHYSIVWGHRGYRGINAWITLTSIWVCMARQCPQIGQQCG